MDFTVLCTYSHGVFSVSHSGRLGAKLCCTVSPNSVLRPGEKCRIFPTENSSILFVCWLNKPTKKKVGLLVDLVVDLGEKADWTLTHAYNLAEASNSKLSSSSSSWSWSWSSSGSPSFFFLFFSLTWVFQFFQWSPHSTFPIRAWKQNILQKGRTG